jgi:opacity protein-like surface antigen
LVHAVRRFGLRLAACVLSGGLLSAQAPPAQTSRFLSNFYVGVQLGYIDYAFSGSQVQPGFQAQSIRVPHLAARVFLVGHEFNKYFSAQISDMRPVEWVEYRNVNGDQGRHSVWMNIAGLTAKARLPLTNTVSMYGEGGLGIVTRKGFAINQTPVVKDASYATVLLGGGLEYRVNDNWSLLTGVTAVPGRSADQQPRTVFFSGGFDYTVRHLPAPQAETISDDSPVWTKNIVQVGYVTDALGYGANDFVSKGAVPVFWTGAVQVAHGLSIDYRRNLLHTRRVFALDWGASIASWTSRKTGERFYTTAVYPAARFIAVRTNPVEFYLSYSLAGPALITRTAIDGEDTGKRFTFQDFMSAGVLLGKKRRITAEIRIAHYSNGNLFPENPGVTIPLGFYLGTSF